MLPHWGSLPDPPPAVSGSSFCPMTIIIFLYYSCLLTCLPSVPSFWGHGLWFLCICNVWHSCMRSCLLLLIHSLLYIVFITHNELNKTLATSCESALPFLKQGHTFSHRGGSNGSGGEDARCYRGKREDFHSTWDEGESSLALRSWRSEGSGQSKAGATCRDGSQGSWKSAGEDKLYLQDLVNHKCIFFCTVCWGAMCTCVYGCAHT